MPYSMQNFLADATVKAARELEEALLRLPDEKRDWKPGQQARSALDQVAECAIMSAATIDMIHTHRFPEESAHLQFQEQISSLCADQPSLQKLLHENAARVAEAIRVVPGEDLAISIEMPWGPLTVAEVISYPYWNMTYHTGQVNYIASLLGLLD